MSFVGAGLLEGVYFEDTNFGYIRSSPFLVPSIGKYTIALRLNDNSKFCGWLIAKIDWMNDDSPDYGGGYNPETVEISYNYYPFRLFIDASMGLTADDILSGTIEMGDNVKPPPIYKPYTGEVDSIAGRLAVIADNTPEVSEKIASSRATSSGEVITATDICDIEHTVDVRLSSKNLFDVSKVPNTENITNNGDGTITISGVYYKDTLITLREFCPSLKVGDTVVLKLTSTGIHVIHLFGINYSWYNGYSITITEEHLNSTVWFYGKTDNGTYTISQIWINYGTVTQPYTPYIEDFSAISTKVTVSGSNLFDVSKVPNKNNITNNGDGTITINSTYSCGTAIPLKEYCPALKVGDVVTFNINTTGSTHIYLYGANTVWYRNVPYTITEEMLNSTVVLYGKNDNGTYTISQIWINYGTVSQPYEPYVEPTFYTPNSDGIVEGVKSIHPTMVISTDTPGALITCKYFTDRSICGKFNELTKTFEAAKALI
jgi:DNA/RNA endonuclease YhcR with UshA esterase domain